MLVRNLIFIMLLIIIPLADCEAHFPFLKVQRDGQQRELQLFFAEGPEPESKELLKYVEAMQVLHVPMRGEPKVVDFQTKEKYKSKSIEGRNAQDIYVAHHELGVRTNNEISYLVKYYVQTGPIPSAMGWKSFKKKDIQTLKVIPAINQGKLQLEVLFDDEPVADAEVSFYQDQGELGDVKTDNKGRVEAELKGQLVHGVRVKVVEKKSGEVKGKKYDEIRNYVTVTFPATTWKDLQITRDCPDIPETVTSFGAACTADAIYYYGGHTGDAHDYDCEGHAHTLWRLSHMAGSRWEKLGEGPGLQGLALVSDGEKLYRIGGFSAKNKPGEKQDLWSQAGVAAFDLSTKTWTDLPALPEPRSSFDAIVDQYKIYVLGGWTLQGGTQSAWLKTAWCMDLKKSPLKWEALPEPPFTKRALSVAAHQGKIYAIGGMLESGSPTTDASVYDVQTKTWSSGPAILGEGMTGFGTASFAHEGKLYCSTYDGTLQQLNAAGNAWELIGNFNQPRFFHRMLPAGKNKLVILGGSNMSVGKYSHLETMHLHP